MLPPPYADLRRAFVAIVAGALIVGATVASVLWWGIA